MLSQEGEWLQIAAANYGLCNLLSVGKIPGHASLKASLGLTSLLEMRSTQCNCTGSESGSAIFESEVLTKKSSKRKKPMNDDQMIELDLGKHGPLKVKVAKKSSEDLHIAFTTENVKAFLLYMSEIGADCCIHGRRQYQSSGKYAKKAEWQGYGSVLEKNVGVLRAVSCFVCIHNKLFDWHYINLRMSNRVNGFQYLIYSELVNFSSPLGYHDCLEPCLESSSLVGFSTSPCVVSSPLGCASCFNHSDVFENDQHVEAHSSIFMWAHSSSSLTGCNMSPWAVKTQASMADVNE